MPLMRIVLLVVVVGGLTLFAFSNSLPTLSLVFLGMRLPALSLAAWIGIAIAAGAVTSFFLQTLSYVQTGGSPRRFEQPDEVPPRTRSPRRETPQTPEPEPRTSYTPPPPPPPPPKAPKSRDETDWEDRNDQDWDFEEEPVAPKFSQQEFNREPPPATPQPERTNFEAQQEPKASNQTGSVYSYSYREQDKKQSGVGKTDAVYDANFRVITPPYKAPSEPEADEDDWGFLEEDEGFDEGKNQPKPL